MGRVSVLAVAGIVLSLGLLACGGSGASKEELAEAAKRGAHHKAEQERLRKLEKELKEVHKGGTGNPDTPNPAPAPAPAPTQSSRSSCGGSLSVGPDTTCEFAENVRSEYEYEIGSGSGSITAYSPANNEVYEMFCTASPHECSGAIDATVYFP
jgi:hypothetical protein